MHVPPLHSTYMYIHAHTYNIVYTYIHRHTHDVYVSSTGTYKVQAVGFMTNRVYYMGMQKEQAGEDHLCALRT